MKNDADKKITRTFTLYIYNVRVYHDNSGLEEFMFSRHSRTSPYECSAVLDRRTIQYCFTAEVKLRANTKNISMHQTVGGNGIRVGFKRKYAFRRTYSSDQCINLYDRSEICALAGFILNAPTTMLRNLK